MSNKSKAVEITRKYEGKTKELKVVADAYI